MYLFIIYNLRFLFDLFLELTTHIETKVKDFKLKLKKHYFQLGLVKLLSCFYVIYIYGFNVSYYTIIISMLLTHLKLVIVRIYNIIIIIFIKSCH